MPNLNYREILIACSSIDAVSASLSMSYSDKEVLAARKLVTCGLTVQAFAFLVEGIALGRLRHFESSKSQCISLIWHLTFTHIPTTLMWSYFAVRFVLSSIIAPMLVRVMELLNEVEHASDQGLQIQMARTWNQLPASLLMNYMSFASFVVPHAMVCYRNGWPSWGETILARSLDRVGAECSSHNYMCCNWTRWLLLLEASHLGST